MAKGSVNARSREVSKDQAVNLPLIKYDCEPLTRDVESFLEFFFSFDDINKVRVAIRADPFGEYGTTVYRFYHLVKLYQIPYKNARYTVPSKVFPVAGKEQRSTVLLNIASAALYACVPMDPGSGFSDPELYSLCNALDDCFLLVKPSDPQHILNLFSIEARTQAVIVCIYDLMVGLTGPKSKSEFIAEVTKAVRRFFGTQHPPHVTLNTEMRRTSIMKLIGDQLITPSTPSFENFLQECTKRYPASVFFQKLVNFLKEAHKALQVAAESFPTEKVDCNPSGDTYRVKKRPLSSNQISGKSKKRSKTYKSSLYQAIESSSESDGEIRVFEDASLTQVPSTSIQHQSEGSPGSSKPIVTQPSSAVLEDQDQEITSSAEKSQKDAVSPIQNSQNQRYVQPLV